MNRWREVCLIILTALCVTLMLVLISEHTREYKNDVRFRIMREHGEEMGLKAAEFPVLEYFWTGEWWGVEQYQVDYILDKYRLRILFGHCLLPEEQAWKQAYNRVILDKLKAKSGKTLDDLLKEAQLSAKGKDSNETNEKGRLSAPETIAP
jgi:hypothetical protein